MEYHTSSTSALIKKQIIVTGPESSGKTTLAKALSSALNTKLVLEYARTYLEELNRPYSIKDIEIIALEQYKGLDLKSKSAMVILDTGPLVLKIWLEEKFQTNLSLVDEWFSKSEALFVLCKPDIAWEKDPLRENPSDRQRLFEKYYLYLSKSNKNFVVISGSDRLTQALSWISNN